MGRKAHQKGAGRKTGKFEGYFSCRPPAPIPPIPCTQTYPFQNPDNGPPPRSARYGLYWVLICRQHPVNEVNGKQRRGASRDGRARCSRPPRSAEGPTAGSQCGRLTRHRSPRAQRSRPRGGPSAATARPPSFPSAPEPRPPPRRRPRKVGFGVKGRHGTGPKVCSWGRGPGAQPRPRPHRPAVPGRRAHL